jgi:hypothetical protein
MERKLTVARTSYPWHLRALDAAGGALTRFTSLGTLDRASILDAARRATGLQDWGDEAFLEGRRNVLNVREEFLVVHEAFGLREVAGRNVTAGFAHFD